MTEQSNRRSFFLGLLALAVITLGFGCASAKVTERNPVGPENVPRPNRVLVYDLAATASDLPPDSALQTYVAATEAAPSVEDIALGRELGAQIAKELTARLRDLGLPAVQATGSTVMERSNDLVIRGALVSVEKGNMALRVIIGVGAGATNLQTHFEVYRVTPAGREPMGTGGIEAAGGHVPGILLSMGVGGVVKGLAAGGSMAAGREYTSESIQGAAERTAKEFVKAVKPNLLKRGWIEED